MKTLVRKPRLRVQVAADGVWLWFGKHQGGVNLNALRGPGARAMYLWAEQYAQKHPVKKKSQ